MTMDPHAIPSQIAAMQQAATGPTQVPVEAVDADQLPKERAWTYEEIAAIVGSLYLDSHQRHAIMQEQFKAVAQDYEATVVRLQRENQQLTEDNQELRGQVSRMTNELEARNRGTRTTIASDGDGQR